MNYRQVDQIETAASKVTAECAEFAGLCKGYGFDAEYDEFLAIGKILHDIMRDVRRRAQGMALEEGEPQ